MLEIGKHNNNLEFLLEIENTSLDKITPRLIVEVENKLTLIPLQIDESGRVNSTIDLKEEWSGKEGSITLEILNENNYFVPFQTPVLFSSFEKKPKTIVKEVKNIQSPSLTPSIQLKSIKNPSSLKTKSLRIESLQPKLKKVVKTDSLTEDINSFFKGDK